MNLYYNGTDEPIHHFDSDESPSGLVGDLLAKENVEDAQKYWDIISKLDENERKNKSHTFSMRLLIFVLVVLCLIVIAEYFAEIENEYTKDLFDFFKYLATTLTGYIFAIYNKKDAD